MEHGLIILPTFGLETHTAFMLYVSIGLCVLSYVLKGKLELVPGKVQAIVEIIIETFSEFAEELMGEKGKAFVPFILTFFIFILISNAMGLVPGLVPPTANLNTTLGLALIVFFTTHIVGVRAHGLGYIKHFIGPMWWLAPIMIPIEIFGHIARPISLSMRLFGNMFGHELLIGVLLILITTLTPLAYLLLAFVTVLGVIVVVIQAVIFALLAMAYIGGALEEAH